MYFVSVVYICILYTYAFGQDDSNQSNDDGSSIGESSSSSDDESQTPHVQFQSGKKTLKNDELDVRQYNAEVAAGDHSEFMGSNPHFEEPRYFKDLGRRFVPVYPYKKKVKQEKYDPEEIFQYIQSPKKVKIVEDGDIIPVRASPDVVLAVMMNAKKMAVSHPKPSDPTEEVIRQYMLRSGDYWNDVVKEEIDPDFILRTKKQPSGERDEELFRDSQPISAKLRPGTKLYKLIAKIVKKAPRLVYIINNK